MWQIVSRRISAARCRWSWPRPRLVVSAASGAVAAVARDVLAEDEWRWAATNHSHPFSGIPRNHAGLRAVDGGGGNRTRVRGRTDRTSTSLGCTFDLARTAGVQPPYRRASHPWVSHLRRLALLRCQPVI